MPYYRRPYKRPRYTKKTKYSVQNRAFNILAASETTTKEEIVPPTAVEGTRKVKHIMVNLTKADGGPTAIYWAIVYVLRELLQATSQSQAQTRACTSLISMS